MDIQYGHAGRRGQRRRLPVIVAIMALHGLIPVAAHYLPERERPREQTVPVQVALMVEQPREVPPAAPAPRLEAVRVDLPLPVTAISTDPRPAQATSVAVQPDLPSVESAQPVPAPREQGPLLVDAVDYLRATPPRYPAAAKRARSQGTVLVRVLIDTEGHPRDVSVHRSSGSSQLDAAACDSIRVWLFKPHRENGVPRMVQAIVPVEFSLAVRTAGRH